MVSQTVLMIKSSICNTENLTKKKTHKFSFCTCTCAGVLKMYINPSAISSDVRNGTSASAADSISDWGYFRNSSVTVRPGLMHWKKHEEWKPWRQLARFWKESCRATGHRFGWHVFQDNFGGRSAITATAVILDFVSLRIVRNENYDVSFLHSERKAVEQVDMHLAVQGWHVF